MSIHQNIKLARLKAGLTQEMLADKTNLSLRTIQRIEKGETKPRMHTLNNISKILAINLIEPYQPAISDVDDHENINFILKLSALGLSFLPGINILSTIAIWKWKKNTMACMDQIKMILTAQILATICLIIILLLIPIISQIAYGQNQVGNFPIFTLLYLIFVCSNIYSAMKIENFPLN